MDTLYLVYVHQYCMVIVVDMSFTVYILIPWRISTSMRNALNPSKIILANIKVFSEFES